jgi:peptidoglycan/LPS O-acetylase OafA/YrhL
VSALLVLTEHTRHAFFVEYHEVLRFRAALFLPYLISAAGHEAVVIFFVLSGFLVGGSVLRSLERNTWSWRQYLTHRFVRLWLVLLPALVLVVFWDSLDIAIQNQVPTYSGFAVHRLIGEPIADTLTPSAFFGNAAFLQGLTLPKFLGGTSFPTLGSDGALWSLTNEFWYYILFPLGLFTIIPHYRPFQRILMAIAFALIACLVGQVILVMFLIWLCGVLLSKLPKRRFSQSTRVLATVIYAAVFLGCAAKIQHYDRYSDYTLAAATTVYLWFLLGAYDEPSPRSLGERLIRKTSAFSYTLYLVHMPLLYFVAGFLIHDTRWQPTMPRLLIALALWSFLILYSWLIATLTEFRIVTVRTWVEARMDALFGA